MIVGWDISRGGDLGKGKITGESEKRLGRSSFLANPQSCLPLFNFNSWAMTSSYDKQQSRMRHLSPEGRIGLRYNRRCCAGSFGSIFIPKSTSY